MGVPGTTTLTNKGRIEIILRDGGITSTGASLTTTLAALAEPDLIWYSSFHGDIDDNITIIAVTASQSLPQFHEPYEQEGPIRKWVGDLFPITEYKLNAALAEQYGIRYTSFINPGEEPYNEIDMNPENLPPQVRYYIGIHDEYFIITYPATTTVAHKYVAQILDTYSFYFKREINWGTIAEQLTHLLFQRQALVLKSKWARDAPILAINLPKNKWAKNIWPGLEYQQIGYISFDTGDATIHIPNP